jgi:hypothetical protein
MILTVETTKPPVLTPRKARDLRAAVTAKASITELREGRLAFSRAHPDWSAEQVELAAMYRVAQAERIDW